MKAWILRIATTYLIKNWRTSVTGAIAFLITQFPQFKIWIEGHGYSMDAVQGFVLMVIAFLAKDGSVSNAPAPVAAQHVGAIDPTAGG